MFKFQYKPIKYNYSSRHGSKIKYLVVHDTGNRGKGANALSHYKYFSGGNRGASAHYFVDKDGTIQIIGDSLASWHVGDGKNRYGISNRNSIGIEMCINSDGDYAKTVKNTIELVKNLMETFNIPIENVVRHYDASRKNCPQTMNNNGDWSAWWSFKEKLKEPKKLIIDTSKDSIAKPVQNKEDKEGNKVENKDAELISSWAVQDIAQLIEKDIIRGDANTGNIRPKDNITREEAFVVINRAINYILNSEK